MSSFFSEIGLIACEHCFENLLVLGNEQIILCFKVCDYFICKGGG